jgi:hypothetical protein
MGCVEGEFDGDVGERAGGRAEETPPGRTSVAHEEQGGRCSRGGMGGNGDGGRSGCG